MMRTPAFWVGLLIGTALLNGCQARRLTPTDAMSRSAEQATDAYLAYERGDCEAVTHRVDREEIESWERTEIRYSLLLLHGFCQELAGSAGAAIETYRSLIRDAPLSFASDDARERLRILRLFERDPDYPAWVDAAHDRAASGSSSRVPVERTPAAFPPLARRAGIEGYAVVEFGVTPRGDTHAPTVVDSRPPLIFDGVALRAVREWHYTRDAKGSESSRQVIRLVFQPQPEETPLHSEEAETDGTENGSVVQ
ncbi:MAG: energy transducer TonB [bacterium]|nr:hypothetical protein [Deltaproteobacteria bacterium]MCP4904131.1 energy transducer TonB [bacterium]